MTKNKYKRIYPRICSRSGMNSISGSRSVTCAWSRSGSNSCSRFRFWFWSQSGYWSRSYSYE